MKIAVTYENGMVFQHFGHTEQFKIYETENGQVVSSRIVPTAGQGHGALAAFLADNGVDALICGSIGGGAQMALAEADTPAAAIPATNKRTVFPVRSSFLLSCGDERR